VPVAGAGKKLKAPHQCAVAAPLEPLLAPADTMPVRGVSMDEIARRLRRDHGDVRDKVAEMGRACR
jgi:hypothetical protein